MINVCDHGAVGDGLTDCTGAFQAAVNAAIYLDADGRRRGDEVIVSRGTYLLTDTVVVHNVRSLRMIFDQARILYAGPVDKPAFQLSQTLRCSLEGLEALPLTPLATCVRITNTQQRGDWITSECLLDGLNLPNAGGESWGRCVEIDSFAGGGNDTNNEYHTLRDCSFTNYKNQGLFVRGSQIHDLEIAKCSFNSDVWGLTGIHFDYGCFARLRQCRFGRNLDADIYAGTGGVHSLDVDGINSEHSGRIFKGDGPSGASFPVAIRNGRLAVAPPDPTAPGAGDPLYHSAFIYQMTGPVTLENLTISAVSPKDYPIFFFGGFGGGNLSLRNVRFALQRLLPSHKLLNFASAWNVDSFGCTVDLSGSSSQLQFAVSRDSQALIYS